MKKENGWSKIRHRFVRRVVSLAAVGAMAVSMLPMTVGAAETDGSSIISDGKAWELLSQVTIDDYESVEGSSGGISWWGGKKSDNTGFLIAIAGSGKYSEFKTNAGHQRIHQGTGISEIKNEGSITSTPTIPGANVTKVFKLNRGWSQNSGSWVAGPGKGAPDSRVNISGLFDNTKVAVGDTIKITAWVLGTLMHDATTATDSMKPDDAATVTMWLSDKARSGAVASNGPAANYNYDKPTVSSETASYDDMKQGEWKEISLTYTVTEGNKDVTGIGINSDKMGSDKVAAFPLNLYLAGVKVEKFVEAKGSYTVSGSDAPFGYHWETVDTVNMDGFTMGTKGDWSYDATKTVDGRTVTVSPDGAGKKIHQSSDFYTPADIAANYKGTTYNMDSITANLPSVAGDKLFLLNRALNQNGNDWAYKWPSPSSAIRVKNIFDTSKIANGEKVRISAWVYPARIFANYGGISANPGPSEAADQTQTTKLRMWLTDSTLSPNAPNTKRPGEVYYDSIVTNQWNQVAITYTVDDYNKAVANVRIDSAISDADQKDPYPLYLALAGVKAEKLVANAAGSDQGTVSGTLTAKIDAADAKILVAAYQGKELLGCEILNADTATTRYSFRIADAYGTDKVVAYVWKLDKADPQLTPITLTAN